MTLPRRAPGLNAFRVPPINRGEQRNTEHSGGTEQRNTSGTLGLKALAEQALSRLKSGTVAEQPAEQRSKKGVPPAPSSVPLFSGCPHVTDDWLREWYAEHPEVVCARCWLEGKGGKIRAQGAAPTDATRNHGGGR